MSDHLLLVDASGFAYRAHATSNPVYRESDGEPIGATLRFMEMVWRLLGEAKHDPPSHGVAVFDPPGKTFRSDIYPKYKANRPEHRGLELRGQFPFMKNAAETLGMHAMEIEGFEADDVIATLANAAMHAYGMFVTIVSSDKDMGQLVEDTKIELYDPMTRRRVLAADIEARFGVPPALVADVQALAGDTVDNIPGVKGCGLKTAAGLVRRFGPLESVLANFNEARTGGLRSALKKEADKARMCLKLTTLRRDVPLPAGLGFSDLILQPVLKTHLKEILRVLEAPHYMEPIFALDPKMARLVPALEGDPEEWWREELIASGQTVPQVPQCGFYRRRLVRYGPWVGARIWREADINPETGEPSGMDILRCDVGGVPRDPVAQWVALAPHPTPASEYKWKIADAAHAKVWRPDSPEANPGRPIDLVAQPAPRNPRAKR